MNHDEFFSSPRWGVLEIIAKKPSSPSQIAKILGTSVAYISQQLKLLEAANLVKKTRTRQVEKGQPRTLFSISKESVHITALIQGFPIKKLLKLTDHNKVILRIWALSDQDLHYPLEKTYWALDSEQNVKAIFLDKSSEKPKILVVSKSKSLQNRLETLLKDFAKKLSVSIIPPENSSKISEKKLHVIYDPSNLYLQQMKGGTEIDGIQKEANTS